MTAIEFENISKQYQLGKIGTGTLSLDLVRWWAKIRGKEDPFARIGQVNNRTKKAEGDFVWALRDINFKVDQGEVVGIIGKNGSGKSTLLKILSRVTSPTTGYIRGKGRIASLLEVGTGFHPEMTGRENVYMNGSIMGMTKSEIDRKFDEIVDFAGVAMFIDTPVKRYSSGMMVRLAFAIAAHLEPEILVVDEVLAVGDAEFQKKAIGKMQSVTRGEGRTVFFVSHNMGAVRNLCNRGIVLNNGTLEYDGDVDHAIDIYTGKRETAAKRIVDAITQKQDHITIESVFFNGSEETDTVIVNGQESVTVKIIGHTSEPIEADAKVIFRTLAGIPVIAYAEGRLTKELQHLEGDFTFTREIQLPKYLAKGNYYIDIYLHRPTVKDYFSAPCCITLRAEGSCPKLGVPLDLDIDGGIGLMKMP